ncbi:phosphatase PAP2 family protein [Kocuria sp. cx-455]|uniref:phosphatase PAP2 family protein n=1 Tax=Kocuria sp. cx-455 TaxID=2771377 RepID=UPI0028047E7A|nr:phosphatase PAP2 family protein [Kocuria sp. cx-455]
MALTSYISLMTMTGQSLDDEALTQAKADRTTFFPWIFLAAARHVPELVSIAAAVLALVWTVRTRRWIPALVGLGMILGANLTTQFLKRVLLDKPDYGIQQIVHNSFPSGHTTATATILVTLLLVAPPHLRAKTATWGWVMAAITGMLTVLNGWHRPSDAAAALLVVGAWGVLAVLSIRLVDGALSRPGVRPTDAYRRVRQKMAVRRGNLLQREDRGDSAFIPPAAPRQQPYQEQPPQPHQYQHPGYQHPGYQQGTSSQYGRPGYGYAAPVRPRLGAVITLIVLAAGLTVTVALLPWPAVSGTGTGRATVIAGYLGIAAASALSWRAVARWLRSLS